jgi:hypothetical protein
MVFVVGVDHTPTSVFAMEAYTLSPDPPPISMPVPKQLGGQGLETPPTVSDLPYRAYDCRY